ncbi:hypothetical protein POM88_044662 [Heracleum sosnowskyi]|uniref:Zinc knuckle CX2CX4HX4C domain-containing protein n=1 Tax=Heracleum sosnowskyi TaxID=360622 RepID=A0AAD8H4W4_9APIA|nr:hypothetical protein POM88_044662 [Heracleum sosnowskyi]
MSSTDSLIQSMNMVTIEDEEEIGYEIIAEEQEQPSQYFQGFNPKLCVVGRFIVEVDIRRVMEGCPWSFNRRALVMSRLKDGENPRSVVLNSLELWVQVYDMKPGFMSEKILQGIGNYIGHHVSNCQSNFNGVWKEYMRIRVSINLNNPLRRRMKMKMNGEEWFWVNFRYENVPMFCFICGIVGHSEKYCSKLFEHEAEEITKPYGPWLRAPFRGQGHQFTWERDVGGAEWIEVRLDRALVTSSFLDVFTDAKLINLEQAWRLIQFPEKLVSQVFKARYFPNGSYLDAQIGSNPSYIWRSILAAQEMIKQGVSCRVGSGETINILNSPWLPSDSDPYIRTQSQSLINQKVAALMMNGERKWDEEVIYDIFSQRDAEMILSIPLDHDNVDNWYWRRDKLGMYTVKGGYLFLQELKQPTRLVPFKNGSKESLIKKRKQKRRL